MLNIFLEHELKELENSAQIFNALSDIPGDIDDVDLLFKVSSHFPNLIKICYTGNEPISITESYHLFLDVFRSKWIINRRFG